MAAGASWLRGGKYIYSEEPPADVVPVTSSGAEVLKHAGAAG